MTECSASIPCIPSFSRRMTWKPAWQPWTQALQRWRGSLLLCSWTRRSRRRRRQKQLLPLLRLLLPQPLQLQQRLQRQRMLFRLRRLLPDLTVPQMGRLPVAEKTSKVLLQRQGLGQPLKGLHTDGRRPHTHGRCLECLQCLQGTAQVLRQSPVGLHAAPTQALGTSLAHHLWHYPLAKPQSSNKAHPAAPVLTALLLVSEGSWRPISHPLLLTFPVTSLRTQGYTQRQAESQGYTGVQAAARARGRQRLGSGLALG